MTTSTHDPAAAAAEPTPAEVRAQAASDLRDALGWLVFGVAVLVGSIRMDRLEAQHINPYTVPGLLPGLLGLVTILLGVLLGLRSWGRGARLSGGPRFAVDWPTLRRLGVVLGLILVYTVVLLGRGLPFWIGAALYVTASIVLLQAPQRALAGRGLSWRDVAFAAAVGIGSGVIITYVFQELFLVRLP
ncbi:MAG: tripartite tricarboxylate transporter TctB family protein [Burkholderiales bacterium]|nr:tripartite tricarboxylate transporter TctB family protein [Burkholderiales bacterium]